MPDTAHPGLADRATFLRRQMSLGVRDLLIFEGHRFSPLIELEPETRPTEDIIPIRVHRCGAPAPWTGRPYVYEWRVALDPSGRWVASSAWPEWPTGTAADQHWYRPPVRH